MLTPLPLRDHARRWLADRIVRGLVSPDARIGVTDIAAALGISTTPAREALTQLERDGLLRAEPNRGFFVSALDLQEAQDLYPILWTLEGLALRSQGTLSSDVATALREINNDLDRAADDPERALECDEEWHSTLVASCPNHTLLGEIATIRRRVLRYEYAFMRDSGKVPSSVQQHTDILDALLRNDEMEAATRLETHWSSSLRFLADWLKARS